MARYREPFIVFPRTLASGRVIYYFQSYSNEGIRTNPKSTGQVKKGRAKAWCVEQLKAGTLIEQPKKTPTLRAYTVDYFLYDRCPFIQARLKRGGAYSKARAESMRRFLDLHVLPSFGSKRLDQITPKMIENWLHKLKEQIVAQPTEEGEEPKKRSAASAMHIYGALRTILSEAHRLGDIPENPCTRVKPLVEEQREKGILTPAEISKLFDSKHYSKVWGDQLMHSTVNRLAAATGMSGNGKLS